MSYWADTNKKTPIQELIGSYVGIWFEEQQELDEMLDMCHKFGVRWGCYLPVKSFSPVVTRRMHVFFDNDGELFWDILTSNDRGVALIEKCVSWNTIKFLMGRQTVFKYK